MRKIKVYEVSIKEAIQEVQTLYYGLGWPSLFAKLKFYAAPFERIAPHVPDEGFIVDLGCGYGIFANLLGLLSAKRTILGLDLNAHKIRLANRGLPNVECRIEDITAASIHPADCIILVHVLHHLTSYQAQEKIVGACVANLKPGGILIVTEVDRKPWWKYIFCSIADRLLYMGDPIRFRSSKDFLALLRSFFLDVTVVPMHQGTLFSHITFLGRKST